MKRCGPFFHTEIALGQSQHRRQLDQQMYVVPHPAIGEHQESMFRPIPAMYDQSFGCIAGSISFCRSLVLKTICR
ncbi:MAG: hypothetical protein ACXV78_00905 [Candidatus Angelobacter sp.]